MKYTNNMYYDKVHDCWMHRPLLKRIVNPILRTLQFWTDRPWVIASDCEIKDGISEFKKYCLARVKYLGPFKKENCE